MLFQTRSLVAAGTLLLATAACARPSADAAPAAQATTSSVTSIRLVTDSFAVRFQHVPEGADALSMIETDSGYRYVERLSLPPIFRLVEVDMDAALHIRRARSETRVGSRIGRSDVRYVHGRAQGTATPLMGRSAVAIDTLLPPGAFDGVALYPMVLSRRWQVGQVDTLTIWDTDELSITRQTFRITGAERVRVPAGEFDALRAELSTTQLPVTLWLSAAVPHRLLKVTSANGESVLVR